MNIPLLLADFQRQGIILSVVDGELKFRAPKGALTAGHLDVIRAAKADIIAFLLAREAGRELRAVRGRPGPLTASVVQEMWYRFAGGPDEGKPTALNIMMLGQFEDAEPAALVQAIRDVVSRHETLRTHITRDGEDLNLSLNPADGFRVEQEDLRGLGAREAQAEVRDRALAFCAPLNPMLGEWLGRAKVYAMPCGAAVAALSFSHIVTDAGSRNIVMDELEDALRGRPVPPAIQTYNEFSLGERDWLAGPQGERLIAYWRRWYEECPLLSSPVAGTPLLWGNGVRIVSNFAMPRRMLRAVQRLAEELRTTPFAVHLTIFALALSRWARSEDFALRILGDKRVSLDLAKTVGLMFCGDAIRVHAPAAEDFASLLRRVTKEYEASLSLRLPTLHFYPPQCVRPGIEPMDMPNRIPAVFNYYSAGTERERSAWEAQPQDDVQLPWPPQVQQMPPARWPRRSAPVFIHIMDHGTKADCSLHFFEGVVTPEEQKSFAAILFAAYVEVAPA